MKKKVLVSVVCTMFICLFSTCYLASATETTQGGYAIRLAEALGLGKDLSVDAAIAALTKVEIMPAGGFKPEDYMAPVIASEILNAAGKACKKGLLSSLPCCKQLFPLPDRCCVEVNAIITRVSEELGLLPPAPPSLPPPPPRHPASPSS